jgi:predicted RNase H-like HicB family nuclease
LISKPNNIIPTTKSVDEAMRNLMEVPHRTLDASYFQEQNDFERQIQ